MSVPIVDLTQVPIAPGTTPEYGGQIVDQNGAPLGASVLNSFTLSIVDTVTKAVVNSVSDVNILNSGRGSVDVNGNVLVTLTALDTALLVATHAKEARSLLLFWTWNGGARSGAREIRFMIEALSGT